MEDLCCGTVDGNLEAPLGLLAKAGPLAKQRAISDSAATAAASLYTGRREFSRRV